MSPLVQSLNSLGPWVTGVLLLSLRLGAMLLPTPLMAVTSVPVTVRIMLVVGLAAVLCPAAMVVAGVGPLLASLGGRPGALVQAALTELALGTTMALGIHFAFAAFAVAGRLLDIQIGFGLSQVFDPALGTTSPVLTTAFNQVAMLAFFLLNGHHAVMRAIAYSLQRLPLGMSWSIDSASFYILRQASGLFALSFALAAPVIFCILLTELALGVIARNLPQINMLTMGIPIKIVVGLVVLSLCVPGIGQVMDRIYGALYASWDGFFSAAR